MTYNAAWDVIGQPGVPIARSIITDVNSILFSPDPAPSELARVEFCVILGSRNCGYKARRAAELFGANESVVFIACGANLTENGLPEAELLTSILLERGIAADRIVIDEHSTNTAGNLFHAERLLSERGADPRSAAITILSSGFHRRHVFASLPPALAHASYVSAMGPHTGPETWHTNALGRAVILHELQRPAFADDAPPR